MTKQERSRANALGNALRTLNGKLNGSTAKLILTAAIVLVTDILWIVLMTRDDELYVALILHVAFTTMFGNMFVCTVDMAMGINSGVRDMGNQTFIGSAQLGKFLCTMPYEAKDVSGLRLICWERHMVLNAVMTSVLMLLLELFGRLGYTEYGGIVGAAVLMGALLQAAVLPLCQIIKSCYVDMFLSVYLCMLPVMLLAGAADDSGETSVELALAFNERLGAFGVVSGVSGVFILTALTAVLIAAAELFTGKMKKTSWNLGR